MYRNVVLYTCRVLFGRCAVSGAGTCFCLYCLEGEPAKGGGIKQTLVITSESTSD